MKKLLHAWERPSDGQWLFGGLMAAVVVCFALIGLTEACSSAKQQLPVSAEQTAEAVGATSTPETTPLAKNYTVGQILGSTQTYSLCRLEMVYIYEGTSTTYDKSLHCDSQLHRGDVVQISGKPQIVIDYYEDHGWYWPVRVLRGGIYAEGQDWLIADSSWLYQTTLTERPKPDVTVGETLLTSYNFCFHDGPGGPCRLDALGRRVLVFGGWSVTLTGEPVLAEGRYWCPIQLVGEGSRGYISCKFKKIS